MDKEIKRCGSCAHFEKQLGCLHSEKGTRFGARCYTVSEACEHFVDPHDPANHACQTCAHLLYCKGRKWDCCAPKDVREQCSPLHCKVWMLRSEQQAQDAGHIEDRECTCGLCMSPYQECLEDAPDDGKKLKAIITISGRTDSGDLNIQVEFDPALPGTSGSEGNPHEINPNVAELALVGFRAMKSRLDLDEGYVLGGAEIEEDA